MKRLQRTAFTLIEMLTVIAIMAVLMTIIVVPIFQSFNLTRAAEAFADAQDQARRITERIAREIGNAVSVRNESALISTTLNGNSAVVPAHNLIVQVPGKNGQTVEVSLPYTKVDIIVPAQGNAPANGSYKNNGGMYDPTLRAPVGQPNLPVTPGTVMVRYFVGLRDPFSTYNDPYTGILMTRTGNQDNLYVLRRSVFVEMNPASPTTGNSQLFALDSNNQPLVDDPRFFVADRDSTGKVLQDAHNVLIYHWLGQAAPWETPSASPILYASTSIQTEFSRYDMIMPQYNQANQLAVYDGNIPRLTPLVQFRPTVISNDPAAGQEAVRPGQETDNAAAIAPDVFMTQYGLWSNAVVRTYPAGFLASDSTRNGYNVAYTPANLTGVGFSVFAYFPANGPDEFTVGTETFDTDAYSSHGTNAVTGQYGFSYAAELANTNSGWLNDAAIRAIFTPLQPLSGTGKLVTSFDISEVGTQPLPSNPNDYSNGSNMPIYFSSVTPAPVGQDTSFPSPPALSGPDYDINHAFNYAWNTFPDQQQNLQRFIDLRVTPNEDGTYGPLYPGYLTGQVTGFQVSQPDGSMLSRCRIVPGSETVYGPDQAWHTNAVNYGHLVRYMRTTHAPGPNQYRINYVDQPEPSLPNPTTANPNGSIVSAASYAQLLNLTTAELGNFNPTVYDPTNFVSATIQPRYKAGYIQLWSDPNVPIPAGYTDSGGLHPVPIKVDYRFTFTGTLPAANVPPGAGQSDVLAVDYDSRQLMQVLLTVRNYPQATLMPNPQSVTLKATATIRNVIR